VITEGDALWMLSSYCPFCKEGLEPHKPYAESKSCVLGHGYFCVHEDEYDDVAKVAFEPTFLVYKRDRPADWFPQGIMDNREGHSEQSAIFMLLSFCFFCGDMLEVEEGITEVKRCPSGHGIVYVYDSGDDLQTVAFEPAILILEEQFEAEKERAHLQSQ
jgi:ribosomal protein L24E